MSVLFFFNAEGGLLDGEVPGVQAWAIAIWSPAGAGAPAAGAGAPAPAVDPVPNSPKLLSPQHRGALVAGTPHEYATGGPGGGAYPPTASAPETLTDANASAPTPATGAGLSRGEPSPRLAGPV